MKAFEVFIPQTFNDGTSADSVVTGLYRRAMAEFGGYTLGDECEGVWVDTSTAEPVVYRDRIKRLMLFASDSSQIVAFAATVALELDQECVSVLHPDRSVEFVYR